MKDKYLSIAIVISSAILLFVIYSFAGDIRRLYTDGVFVSPTTPTHHFYRIEGRPATISDVNNIAGWMTFNYLNKSFDLPFDYLQTTLGITNPSYPNITISKIVAQGKLSINPYIESVQKAVSAYITEHKPPK